MHRSIRELLVLASVVAIVAGGSLFRGVALAEAPMPVAGQMTASAEALKSDAVTALRRGEFDRTSDLLKKAATSTGDPALEMMASWVANFSSQYDKTLAGRKGEYDKAVAQVQLLQQHSLPDYALDAATRAYSLAIDKRAFRNEQWVDDLVKDRSAAAADYEKSGRWHKSMRIYVDLGIIEPAKAVWKTKLKTATRYVRIQALYTPEQFKSFQKARAKDEDEVLKVLDAAQLTDGATTRPTTQPVDDDPVVDAQIDWHDALKGVEVEMATDAIHEAVENWYRDVSYAQLTAGGLEGLRVLATTPGIDAAFPALADQAKREQFVAELNTELAQLKKGPIDDGDFQHVLERVRNANGNSVGLPETVIVHEFMDGALGELDQFSSMIWPQEAEEFRTMTEGSFAGVGIQIERDKTGFLKVVSPMEDTPAYKAGIKAGSLISHVNGEPVKKLLLDQAIKKIKGPPGTKVTLTIIGTDGVTKDYTLRRNIVKVASIKGWRRLPGGGWDWMVDPVQKVGYVRLTNFTKTSADELEKSLKQMQEQGARGIVLDLRSDPGGLLPAAVDIADMFIPSGTIVSTRADRETPQAPSISTAAKDSKKINMPLIVLVNQFSASASEIVSGALKDQHRAIIVGERTYGKGSVQIAFPVAGRNAAVKLTTHHYYLPSGRCLHREETSTEWGVDPDYKIELTTDQVKAIIDARQEMDVLYSPDDQPKPAPTTKPVNLLDVDPQLSAAIMLMRLEVAGVKL